MKHLKKYEKFGNTMVGSIFTSDYEDELNEIFNELKNNFNNNNLSDIIGGDGMIEYDLNGTKIEVRDDTFFAIPGYTLKINDVDIQCSYLLAKKVYKFLYNKFKIQKKEKVKNEISNLGRTTNKYNL